MSLDASRVSFTEILLGGIVLVMLTAAGLIVVLYLLPTSRLRIPELEPGVRVAPVDEMPVNTARTVHWGERVILVVRAGDRELAALEGVAPSDGCLLRWDAEALRVVSPCTYVVYDLRGNVVAGLTTTPLQRYAASVREGVVYVTGGP